MPKNRRDIERDVKVDELLDAAERLFRLHGYGGATMAGIAREAGVTSNALYWYFPSKDDVFAAVLDRRFQGAQTELVGRLSEPLARQLSWGLRRFQEIDSVGSVVHERAKESPVVAQLHDRFHHTVRTALQAGLMQEGLEKKHAEKGADCLMAVIEGTGLHEGPVRRREELVLFTLEQILVAGRATAGNGRAVARSTQRRRAASNSR
jgi:AcrR family transcriptional regulator